MADKEEVEQEPSSAELSAASQPNAEPEASATDTNGRQTAKEDAGEDSQSGKVLAPAGVAAATSGASAKTSETRRAARTPKGAPTKKRDQPVKRERTTPIKFVRQSIGELRKVVLAGGSVHKVCAMPRAGLTGGTWNAANVIVFSSGGASGTLYRVPAAGGEAVALTTQDAKDIAAYLVPDADAPSNANPPEIKGADIAKGRQLLESKGCAACHTMTGVSPLPNAPPPSMSPQDFERGHKLAPDLRFARERMSAAKFAPYSKFTT